LQNCRIKLEESERVDKKSIVEVVKHHWLKDVVMGSRDNKEKYKINVRRSKKNLLKLN
jgi:hypothetical protein